MSTPQPGHQVRERVEALDLLRMIAVLTVMLFHYAFRGAAADGFTSVSLPELESFAKYGYLGVQLFFVISGFVIAYSADGRTASGFVIARIARIYPGFLFCMTATFLVTLAVGAPRFETTVTQWFANLFIASPALKQPFMDGAYWSIVYEITFYGWIWILILLGVFRRRIEVVVLTWLLLSLINELTLRSPILRMLFLTDQSGFFAAGLLLYEMFRGRENVFVQALFGLSVACAVVQAVVGVNWLRGHFGIAFDSIVVAAISIGAIGAVAASIRIRRVPFRPAVIAAIGGLTYPLYLLHQHIGYMALNKLGRYFSAAVLLPIVILGMTAAAWFVYRFIERPGQRAAKTLLNGLVPRIIASGERTTAAAGRFLTLGRREASSRIKD